MKSTKVDILTALLLNDARLLKKKPFLTMLIKQNKKTLKGDLNFKIDCMIR